MASDAIERAASAAMPAVSGEVRLSGFGEVVRVAEYLAQARGFVPDVYVEKPAALSAVIMTGLELGIGPMEAMRSIHMVKGKPMLDASLLARLALRAGVTIDYQVSTAEECTLVLTRSGRTHRETWTIADAKRAGLLSNDVWSKYPKRMLQCRALSSAIRAWCPDVIGAAVYVEGELEAAADVVPLREAPAAEVVGAPDKRKRLDGASRLSTAMTQILPAASTADDLRAWATDYADVLGPLANGARAKAIVMVRSRCAEMCTTADGEVIAEHADALSAEILGLAGLG